MNRSLISVIVPVYNVEKYLDECVMSIMNQTHQNLEIILVDDGSTDRSSEMCDAFAQEDSRVKVVHKKNGGASSARNAGLDIATGEYFGFVDSDDYIMPDIRDTAVDDMDFYADDPNGKYNLCIIALYLSGMFVHVSDDDIYDYDV